MASKPKREGSSWSFHKHSSDRQHPISYCREEAERFCTSFFFSAGMLRPSQILSIRPPSIHTHLLLPLQMSQRLLNSCSFCKAFRTPDHCFCESLRNRIIIGLHVLQLNLNFQLRLSLIFEINNFFNIYEHFFYISSELKPNQDF